ncbi:STAS domain-containing protein [Streptomyces sp. NBC_00237]|uniref:STAS domain-containing protein n=1 Tax=Streptomyces sp. NBC_00237 TaxID=2975687 RepID=UPI002258EFD6|nr:STAS domain-containing protein [Streptomyces sp. NBC_00237]MCX5204653.1 STAS domain-containing protein [Streptomyces sp. NBC_00237]
MFEDSGVFCEIEVRRSGAMTVAVLRGELDLSAAHQVGPVLVRLVDGPGTDLVLDLRQVSFLDCGGIGMLCRVRNQALARQGRLRLVVDSPFLLRTLRVLGLEGPLGVMPGLDRDPARASAEASG